MRPALLLFSVLLLLAVSTESIAQKNYGLPVSPNRPKAKNDRIEDVSQRILDSLGIKGVSVQTDMGYCDVAKPAIVYHRQHGPSIISNNGPGCPLTFRLKKSAKQVSINFTGCAGKFKAVGYDSQGNKVTESIKEITLWENANIALQAKSASISHVTIARGTGCSTYIKGITTK